MPTDRRTWGLIGLGAVAVALVVWTLQGQGQAPATPAKSAAAPARGRPAPSTAIEDVRLESLTASRVEPAGESRNPFRFEARRAAAGDRPPATVVAPPPPIVTAPPVPTGPPPPPPIPFKFIGIVERTGSLKVAVLTDGRTVVHGKEGDIIEGQYRILRIGVESIEMAYADGRGRQTIRLTGQ